MRRVEDLGLMFPVLAQEYHSSMRSIQISIRKLVKLCGTYSHLLSLGLVATVVLDLNV